MTEHRFEIRDNHVDLDTTVHSPREVTTQARVRCDCGEWVGGFYVGGQVLSDGPVEQECTECGRAWAIGALEVRMDGRD